MFRKTNDNKTKISVHEKNWHRDYTSDFFEGFKI